MTLDQAAQELAAAEQALKTAKTAFEQAQDALTSAATNRNQAKATFDAIAAATVTPEEPDPNTFDARKAAKGASMLAKRDAVISGGIPVAGIGVFDSNLSALVNVMGAVQTAQIATSQGQPFSIEWTLADNTTTTLDAAEMITVGTTFSAFINAAHSRARVLGALITAAEDDEALDAIDITTGWPGTD